MLHTADPVNENAAKLIDTQTGQRIHEHLSNPNDVITEDDIRNVVTSIGIANTLQDPLSPDQFAPDTDGQ